MSLPQPKGPHTAVKQPDKTDPPGGSSQRSLSREVLDSAYAGAARESNVKTECDPDKKDATPEDDIPD